MKRRLAICILFLLCKTSFGQTKEHFLNAVHRSIFTTSNKVIYLSPEAGSGDKHIGEIKKKTFSGIAPINIANELYNSIKKDTITEYWDCQLLEGATCASFDSLKSKGHLDAFYHVSKPIFSKDKKWSVVSVGGSHTEYNHLAWGKLYLFHWVGGKWKAYVLMDWIS